MNTNPKNHNSAPISGPIDRAEARPDANGHDTSRSNAPPSIVTAEPESSPDDKSSPSHEFDADKTTQREVSRLDAVDRDYTRPDAVERDASRLTAPDRDEPRQDAPVRGATLDEEKTEPSIQAANWLDVEQASIALRDKGVSRTIRTIQKMCKRGDLESKLVPTENGVRYIISDQSIDDFVTRHNEKMPSGSLGSEEAASHLELSSTLASESGSAASVEPRIETDQAANVPSSHLREIIDLKDQQITMMQSQIDTANAQMAVKDEQIATMHERDHETNVLIQNLQNLVALPSARSDNNPTPPPINVNQQSG